METEVQINKVTYPKVLALKYVTPTGAKLSSKVKKKKVDLIGQNSLIHSMYKTDLFSVHKHIG